ncbi:MAG: S-layer protein [Leptolyngbya sp. ERB_1_1]
MKSWYLTTATSLLTALLLHAGKASAQSPSIPVQTTPRSGCLSGYPDGTYRGDRPMTRYEFAAGMDACVQQVDQSIRFNRENFATRADFERLIQRQRELNNQLQGLSDRVNTLSNDSPAQK